MPRQAVVPLQLHPRPANRPFGPCIEPVRIEEGSLIVIAEEHHLAAVANELRALTGVGTVSDDVAKAVDFVDSLPLDILEHSLESLEVAVDVADDGAFHASRRSKDVETLPASYPSLPPGKIPMPPRELPPRGSAWRVIAIDTSRPRGSVAAGLIHGADRVMLDVAVAGLDGPGSSRLADTLQSRLYEQTLATPADHARLLAAAIERTTAASGWHPAEADLVAVVAGPGSFTGLRVGVTAAKMLAWTTRCRLVAISAFELAAARGGQLATSRWPNASQLELGLDAGRGEVHATTAVRDPLAIGGWRLSEPQLIPQDHWLTRLEMSSCETGAVAVIPPELKLTPSQADLRLVLATELPTATACDVARLGMLHAEHGAAANPATLVPTYLRPSYAEERRKN
jgi:tRNA threonylcarbamoyladenosine biosynthesis protein TsaB